MRAVTDADDDDAGYHSTTTRATYRQKYRKNRLADITLKSRLKTQKET